MSYTTLLAVEPKKSIQVLAVLLATHLISIAVLLLVVRGYGVIKFVMILLIVASWVYYYRLHVTKVLRRSVIAAYHQGGYASKGWSIRLSDEKVVDLLPSSYRSQWWIVLNFCHTPSNERYTLLVPADSVSAETHRQLRVRLHLKG